jgi:hypothetical protein
MIYYHLWKLMSSKWIVLWRFWTSFVRRRVKKLVMIRQTLFFSKNVDMNTRNRLLQTSEFRETIQLGDYLGVPLTGRVPRWEDFQYIIDQVTVTAKLASWKTHQNIICWESDIGQECNWSNSNLTHDNK